MDFTLMDLQEHETLQYCLPSGNGSCPKEVRQKTTYVTLYFLLVTVVLITVCGNLAVIISISHFKKLHTPTNLLVLSLAFTDLSVGVFTMPLTLIKIIESCWYFGDIICFAYVSVSYLLITLSVTHLIFIAIDRYFAICDPLLYSVKITVPVTFFFIFIVWILSILYIFILVSCNGYISGVKISASCTEDCNYTLSVTWWAIDAAVIFFLPCSVMVGLYGKIFVVARRHAQVIRSLINTCTTEESKKNIPKKSERKAAKTLGIVITFFTLCYLPTYLSSILQASNSILTPSSVMQVISWITVFNSGINPIIYALFFPWFKKSLKLIITLKICDRSSSLINIYS